MRELVDRVLYRFGYVRADDEDYYDEYPPFVPREHDKFDTTGVDVFRIHVGEPGPKGIENLSRVDPSPRVMEDFWDNQQYGLAETITHASKWRDGQFIEAKELWVSQVWGGGPCTLSLTSYT